MRAAHLVVGLAAVAGCFNPTFDAPSCGPQGECPPGLACSAGVCRAGEIEVDAAGLDGLRPDGPAIDGASVDASPVDGAPVDGLVDASGIDAPTAIDGSIVDSSGTVTVAITMGPANSSTTGPRVTFAFTASTSMTECKVDGGAFASCTSPVTYNLSDMTHTFTVRALDGMGGMATDARTWEVVCSTLPALPDGVAVLHFEETSGQIVTNDVTTYGGGVLGTNNQVETRDPARVLPARFGRGLDFSRVEQDIVTLTLATTPQLRVHDHTIEAWVRPAGAGTQMIFADPAQRTVLYYNNAGNGNVRFNYSILDEGNGASTVNGPPPSPAGQWYHVVGTYRNNTQMLVVNGVVTLGMVLVADTIDWSTVTLSRTTDDFDGEVDEVYLSNAGITQEQALQRYCPL